MERLLAVSRKSGRRFGPAVGPAPPSLPGLRTARIGQVPALPTELGGGCRYGPAILPHRRRPSASLVRLSLALQDQLVAAVDGRRGAEAADRLCQACVILLDVDAAAISLVFDGTNSGTLGASGEPARMSTNSSSSLARARASIVAG